MRLIHLAFVTIFATLACVAPSMAAIDSEAEQALLMDARTGQVLWEKNGYAQVPPASMSKLMTLELLFQRLKDGRLKLDDTFLVSERAWRTEGSRSFLKLGSRVRIEDLIRAVIIQSGNDACIVTAEGIGGTVEGFVDLMNQRAAQLGLKNSHFVNPDGLPEPPGQMMSSYDLAMLARHLINDYPQYYHYFGEKNFTWNNITQENRNHVLDKLPGADGLKTGHIDASGYGVTASAVRNGQRLILVLNGLRYPDKTSWVAERLRGDEAARILDLGFREFRQYSLFKQNDVVEHAPVFGGATQDVSLVVGAPLDVTLQVDSRPNMKVKINYSGPLQAPIQKGQEVGTLSVSAPDFPGVTVPLYAGEDVARTGIFGRMVLGAKALLGR